MDTDAELDGDCVSLCVGEGLVVGVMLNDPVRVAVRDVDGEGVADADGLMEIDGDAVVDVEGLVEVLAVIEGLVVRVGVGLVEGHTAHSLAETVVSSQRLYCRRPGCDTHVARRAVVVLLQGPPDQEARQYTASSVAVGS